MKRIVFAALMAFGTCLTANATIVINLTSAQLYGANGTTPMADGMLIQLLASTTDAAFAAPTATSFVGGSVDDVVQASYAMSSATASGFPGGHIQAITLTFAGNFNAGDALLLRWWPTLAANASIPGVNTPYGEFRSDQVENGSQVSWFAPSDGANVQLKFLDAAAGGTRPDSAGRASLVTAVPEPTGMGLILVGGLGFAARRRRS